MMEPETFAALAALTVGLSGAAAAYGYVRYAVRKLDEARANMPRTKAVIPRGYGMHRATHANARQNVRATIKNGPRAR